MMLHAASLFAAFDSQSELLNISILCCMEILLCHFGMVLQERDDSWSANVVVLCMSLY